MANPDKEVPVKGMVNLIDLGADSCLPCKMMAPIMTKLEKDYKGKAAIIFIDVWKFPDQGQTVRYPGHTHPNLFMIKRARKFTAMKGL